MQVSRSQDDDRKQDLDRKLTTETPPQQRPDKSEAEAKGGSRGPSQDTTMPAVHGHNHPSTTGTSRDEPVQATGKRQSMEEVSSCLGLAVSAF